MRFNKSKYKTRNIWSILYRFSNIYDVILTQCSPIKIILNMHACWKIYTCWSHIKLILWGKLLKFIGLSLEILWNQTWLKTFSE